MLGLGCSIRDLLFWLWRVQYLVAAGEIFRLWSAGGSVVKNPFANARDSRDVGLIPELGRSPGAGNGNLFQYSCLENPMDRGAWWATVHGVSKSQTWLSDRACTQATLHPPNSGWAIVLCQQPCLWRSFHGPRSRHSPPSPSSPQMVTILSFLLVTSFCLITWMWIYRQYSLVSTIKKKNGSVSLGL